VEIFKIQNLTYYYPMAEKAALKDINLTIREGEFILLLGKSGSGKSTLGRVFNGIIPGFYGGKIRGNIHGSRDVGMVFQDTEKQLVMDKVERELAFGLENLGTEKAEMKRRVMETLSFLNMGKIKDKKTYELSGGEKQKVAIGATLSMGYRFLVLDEPTSQLDPAAAEEILSIIKRLNEDLGYTILLIEQRVDRCLSLADRVLFMEEGSLIFDGGPKEFIQWDYRRKGDFIPTVSKFFLNFSNDIPITVKDGRKRLEKQVSLNLKNDVQQEKPFCRGKVVASLKDLTYVYPNGCKALKGVGLDIHKGEILGIVGENGGGKSTILKCISGLLEPTGGKIWVEGPVGYLSQNPNDYLFNDSVYEEIKFTLDNQGIRDYSQILKVLEELGILKYKDTNPRDLSGGERQRVALASVMVAEPEILLLDEPTRGLDSRIKDDLGKILLSFKEKGKTIIVVSHDMEFIGKFCDTVALVFDGKIVQQGLKKEILNAGTYYTTQINKLFSGYADNLITLEDALKYFEICKIGVS